MFSPRVHLPRASYESLESIILALHGGKSATRHSLIGAVGSEASFKEATPILKSLGLLRSDTRRGYQLTRDGEEIAELIKSGQKDELRARFVEILKRNPALHDAYNILSENPNISTRELGEILARKYHVDKNWKRAFPENSRAVGRSCISILHGFGLIEREPKRIRRGLWREVAAMSNEESKSLSKEPSQQIEEKLKDKDFDVAFLGDDVYVKWRKKVGDTEISGIAKNTELRDRALTFQFSDGAVIITREGGCIFVKEVRNKE